QYFYTKVDDLKIEMLGAATKDAQVRAEAMTRQTGTKLGRMRSASQGIFQITPVYSTDTSNMGILDTTSIEKIIKAVVNIEFGVN
ncbi:MAG: SIMPL domain-containing protein, partial [Verrucomicrobiae bacterium]|nr:SIMPL domain-containing protein [Verrucomicrobiae bacterium]